MKDRLTRLGSPPYDWGSGRDLYLLLGVGRLVGQAAIAPGHADLS